MGRKVRKYTGARDDFPTKFPIRETTFAPGGPISVGVCLMQDVDVIEYAAGSRHEKFQTGGHAGHYYLGSTVYKHNVGGFEAHAGGALENAPFANSLKLTTKGGFEAKVTVGNATMKTSVGTATVSSKVNTNISALVGGVKISSATVITLSSPGSTKYGGIVCGSDLHPIIGQPLAAPTCGLMGSKTVTITP